LQAIPCIGLGAAADAKSEKFGYVFKAKQFMPPLSTPIRLHSLINETFIKSILQKRSQPKCCLKKNGKKRFDNDMGFVANII
jgi:hypothetical protein